MHFFDQWYIIADFFLKILTGQLVLKNQFRTEKLECIQVLEVCAGFDDHEIYS